MKRFTVPALFTLLAASVFAGPLFTLPEEEQPKSPAARGALVKYARAKEDAQRAQDLAVRKAAEEAIAALEKVKAEVMKAGGAQALDEANKIAAAVEHVKADGPTPAITSPVGTWTVTYTNGSKKTYQFQAGGKLIVRDKEVREGRWEAKGNGFTFDEDGERRVTVANDRMFIEVYGRDRLTNVGVGTK